MSNRTYRMLGAAFAILGLWMTLLRTGVETSPTNLIAHEWGTFTSIAGPDGQAVEWAPLDGPTDLPCFVARTEGLSKFGLTTKLRMETPVIYFYAPAPTGVRVEVGFRQGVVTEHYPRAEVKGLDVLQSRLSAPGQASTTVWSNVSIDPRGRRPLPAEPTANHYYAARNTEAAQVTVNGQTERFLFYRGVSGASLPVTVTVGDEDEVTVLTGGHTLRGAVLFERRGDRVGYQVVDALRDGTVLSLPALDDSVASLHADLVRILEDRGLFRPEAVAMVDTWHDSWFEEGTRLFYVIPRPTVDDLLPLSIQPRPADTVRVFVGRVELVTSATLSAVLTAARSNDIAALQQYGRFLAPIAKRLLAAPLAVADQSRLRAAVGAAPASVTTFSCR